MHEICISLRISRAWKLQEWNQEKEADTRIIAKEDMKYVRKERGHKGEKFHKA